MAFHYKHDGYANPVQAHSEQISVCQKTVTSFCSRFQVVSTELFPPVVIVPSAKIQFPSLGAKTYRHT